MVVEIEIKPLLLDFASNLLWEALGILKEEVEFIIGAGVVAITGGHFFQCIFLDNLVVDEVDVEGMSSEGKGVDEEPVLNCSDLRFLAFTLVIGTVAVDIHDSSLEEQRPHPTLVNMNVRIGEVLERHLQFGRWSVVESFWVRLSFANG